MPLIAQQSFFNQRVDVSNNDFVNCIFSNCTLVFSGGPFTVSHCNIHACDFEVFGEKVNPLYIRDDAESQVQLLVPDFEEINRELLGFLAANPNLTHYLHHRKFEEFLGAIFRELGYDVELGPGTGDGGVDLRLIHRSDVGPVLILVQAKKYAPDNPVGLQPVQALLGAVESEKANMGIVVTTSRFLPAAHRFTAENPYRLRLADQSDISQWLSRALHGNVGFH